MILLPPVSFAVEGGWKSDLTSSYLLCGGAEEGGRKSDLNFLLGNSNCLQ